MIRRQSTLVFVLLLVAAPGVSAQTAEDCDLGTARVTLDVNGVRARLFNAGNLFYNGGTPLYEVPAGGDITPIFAAAIWVGGLVDGDLRIAAASYAQGVEDYEYWPGPLSEDGEPPEDCDPYDRIWTVSRTDLARYEQSGIATADLAEWPADLGAPFFDVDGDGAYDLDVGDRPKITGDQMAWWVMNDAGGLHRTTLSPPIGLEVRASAFAVASPEPHFQYTTFYRYELTYRGSGSDAAPFDSAYFGVHVDPDLGNFSDDYVGTDSLLNLVFVYNSDNDDEESAGGYGTAPPALGLRMLDGPVLLPNGRDDDADGTVDEEGEVGLMTAASWHTDNYPWGYDGPDPAGQFYNLLRCRWGDGSQWRVGGDGYCSPMSCEPDDAEATCWVFPNSGTFDDPIPSFWSEVCPQPGCGQVNPPDDRRFHASTGPFRMLPGETVTVTFALVWARGDNNFDSIQQMKLASERVARAWQLGALDPEAPAPVEPEPPQAFGLRTFPNPFAASAAVELTVPEGAGALRLAVYDVLGREVAVLADGMLAPGEYPFALDGAGLPAGVYFMRLETGRQAESLTLIHIE